MNVKKLPCNYIVLMIFNRDLVTCRHATIRAHLCRFTGCGGRRESDLRRTSYVLRAHPLGTSFHATSTMQSDEEIQYAPKSRPVSFYDNYKVRTYSRVFVYVSYSLLKDSRDSATRSALIDPMTFVSLE